MKIDIKLQRSKPKGNEFPLIISIYVSKHDRVYPFTGFYSHEKDWNFEDQMPKISHPEFVEISNYIIRVKEEIRELDLYLRLLIGSRYLKDSQCFYNQIH